jgi:hypothetical protein
LRALLFILLYGFVLQNVLRAQIVINEVSSAGTVNFVDEDNEAQDWIELYNTSSTTINLEGYELINSEGNEAYSWIFPDVNIPPNSHLTVFCSEKNRRVWFDHWEVPVYPNVLWRYFVGTAEPPVDWREISFNDSGWLIGQGGIGYGDGDDSTVIPASLSVYMRKSFFIADTSIIPTAALLIDFDDAFVAYLNGVEIARYGIGVYGDHPAYNTLAYDEHEAQMYQTGNISAAYFIDPVLLDSAIRPGNNVFSIQVHNHADGLDDLTALPYFLIGVSNTSVTYFPFPANIHLHTNFNLNSTGQTIQLKNPSGTLIDQITTEGMQMNNSRGRSPDGATNLCLFDTPSPDTTNLISNCFAGYANAPVFTLDAGFYNGSQVVGISSTTPGVIKWTNNGDDPVLSSTTYTSAISIDSNQVLRARLFPTDPNLLPSKIATNSYFIDENITLPVISLTSDNYNLFDWNYGIYVLGPNADITAVPFMGANFWQGWERPANIEYFDKTHNPIFETNSGIKIQGNYSKAWPQRGFSVKAKDNYGGETIHYKLFKDKPWIDKVKSFNIRNAGSDWSTAHMRDRLNQTIAQVSNVETMAGFPCVLFINGQYWGVYEIREKQDEDYLENNARVNTNYIDFLQFDGSIIEGTNQHFLEMANYIASTDMSVQSNYDSAKAMLDIENFCDYFITETYVVNIDWLGSYTNNIKFWRPTSPVGKWRYILWDTDLSLGMFPSFGGSFTTDMLDVAIHPTTANPHSLILASLLNNSNFKNYFVNRYADLMNTSLLPSNYQETAEAFETEMLPEMNRHFALWGGTSPIPGFVGRSDNTSDWQSNVDSLVWFVQNRLPYARYYIQQQFSLTKQVETVLSAYPENAGLIKINTIQPEPLPWSGIYYDGVPVTMTAVPNPGYLFLYWKSNTIIANENYNQTITLNVDSNDVFTAYFEEIGNYFAAFPNPFSDVVKVIYDISPSQQAELALYDVTGRMIKSYFNYSVFQTEGRHEMEITKGDLPTSAGIYFLKFSTEHQSQTIPLVRTK